MMDEQALRGVSDQYLAQTAAELIEEILNCDELNTTADDKLDAVKREALRRRSERI